MDTVDDTANALDSLLKGTELGNVVDDGEDEVAVVTIQKRGVYPEDLVGCGSAANGATNTVLG